VITVAVTGATGFIGSVLLKLLVDQGFQVRSLYRPASTSSPDRTDSVHWQAGDLGDMDSLRALVAGADAVVHCAGTVRGVTLEHFKEANAAGVARLAEVAVELKVHRFLLMSSLAAREPSLSDYALSKKMGEDVLLGYQGRICCDILRPPAVYGPGDREMRPLLQLVRRGLVPVIGAKNGRFSLLYVDDLAEAVNCLLKTEPAQEGRCFELHDGHPDGYTWLQIAEIASHLNGKKPLNLAVPRSLLQLIALGNHCLARLLGYPPMLTPGKVREIFHPDWVCDNTAISKAVDWQPRILFSEGMKRLFP
jgi:nucleoside-diphosphate-sugar epimerase